jgi:hypothetical protein
VRIRRKTRLVAQLMAKIRETLVIEAAFKIGARLNAR